MEKGNENLDFGNLRFIEEAKLKREIDEKALSAPVSNPIKASFLKFCRLKKFDLKDLK